MTQPTTVLENWTFLDKKVKNMFAPHIVDFQWDKVVFVVSLGTKLIFELA